MTQIRTALYLDFDNVFSGLLDLDPSAAIGFAEAPTDWLEVLAHSYLVDGPRTWLVRRCYMNPAGFVPNPDPKAQGSRLYFSRFRPFFTRAGFEVIDCPALTRGYKNAADIKIVLDVMDGVRSEAGYQEFVIASGDSDLTPLLVRLRAADRRVTLLSPFEAAEALSAIPDRLIDGQQALELLHDETAEAVPADSLAAHETARADEPPTSADSPAASSPSALEAEASFDALVRRQYAEATSPLNLATLAQQSRDAVGPMVADTQWFGHGGFARAIESLELPGAEFSQHYLWDHTRHSPPIRGDSPEVDTPEIVGRLTRLLELPRLPGNIWPHLYHVLAEYAESHEFNLTEATKWSRDRLADQGLEVGRNAFGYVLRGATLGGVTLYQDPPPLPQAIAKAFVRSVLERARYSQVELTDEESEVVARWFGSTTLDDTSE